MRRASGGELSGIVEMESSAALKVTCESMRDSEAALPGTKWAGRLAIRNAKIRRKAMAATVDSPSYPVVKMDSFQSKANST